MNTCGTQISDFAGAAREALGEELASTGVSVLQVNIGYRCNLSCKHCHLESGPSRAGEMSAENIAHVLSALSAGEAIGTLDITGGAPELNPGFRGLVTSARELGRRVIVRTNLAVFFEPGQEGLPEFYADNSVEVVASLPYYTAPEVDRIRGEGVFDKCTRALRQLNSLGYGSGRDDRRLNIVHNPRGAFFAPDQRELEAEFKRELKQRHGVAFDSLLAFTNMPMGRFRGFLERTGQLEAYTRKLREAYNPSTLDGIMCRSLISVGPEGTLFDCDFNQALSLGLTEGLPAHISEFDYEFLSNRPITVDEHCFGCTAGSGST
jgi:radical SAM/Cys-rich protein